MNMPNDQIESQMCSTDARFTQSAVHVGHCHNSYKNNKDTVPTFSIV